MGEALHKLLPHNQDAELSVLGAMLLDGEAVLSAGEIIKAEDFYKEAHRAIFQAMVDLNERGEPVDIVTLTEELRLRGQLDSVGGIPYLALLANSVPSAANIAHYAQIVGEKALLRALIQASNQIAQRGYEGTEEVETLISEAERSILELGQRQGKEGISSIRQIIMETLDQIDYLYNNQGEVTGVASYFTDLDRMTAGFQRSDLIIVAARPAMGKTAFCLNIAQQAAIKGKTAVAVFSLEMSKHQLVNRMLCSQAMIDQSRLRTGKLTEHDWPNLSRAIGPLSEAPIFIDDTPGITVTQLRAKTRRLKQEHDLGMIIIDYLQLMQGGRRSESRQQEISEISRSLKGLARELNLPIIALSQLSRTVEQTADKKPNLSHLRESGALEQDADMVMFIFRDEYYNPESEKKGIAEIIIAKHRNGPTGSVELGFLNEFTKFVNLERGHQGFD